MDEAVFGAGHVLDLHVDLPGDSLDLTDQQARGSPPDVVAPLVGSHSQRVDEGGRASFGGEGGLQHHGLVDVAPPGLEIAYGPEGPVAGSIVE
jgi:hypothetical protein